MRTGFFIGIFVAIVAHAGFILFGGMLFSHPKDDKGTLQKVELYSEAALEDEKKKEKPPEPQEEEAEELKTETEEAPDVAEVVRNKEIISAAANAPELEAVGLRAMEDALNGLGTQGGDFVEALTFRSGRIGGTGKPGEKEQGIEDAFSMSEIDQKPRAVYQASPVYPSRMRSVEGVVSVIFIVDPDGKVRNLRVEKSTHQEFEKPALDAVKQWKFEPAIKGGERVSCKMRVPIRFQPRQG